MDSEELENLKKEYEHLPDAEILELLAVDPSEYEPGVFEIVKAEALRRDLKEIKDDTLNDSDDQEYRENQNSRLPANSADLENLGANFTITSLEDAIAISEYLDTENIEHMISEYHCPAKDVALLTHSQKTIVIVKIYLRPENAQRAKDIIKTYYLNIAKEETEQDEEDEEQS